MAKDAKASRAERRRLAAQARKRGVPEVTKARERHLTGTCAGCVFWDTTDPDVRTGLGICREDSPELLLVPSAEGNKLQAMWPVTALNATCGRHKPVGTPVRHV